MAQWNLQTVHQDVEAFSKHIWRKKHYSRRHPWLRWVAGILHVSL